MPDLGFVEDRLRRGTGIRVWRRGVYVVTLRIGAARAEASVSDAAGPAPQHEAGAVAGHICEAPDVGVSPALGGCAGRVRMGQPKTRVRASSVAETIWSMSSLVAISAGE